MCVFNLPFSSLYHTTVSLNQAHWSRGTHLIFNYKGKNVLKKSDLAYKQEGDGTSHVYRLILKPDNTARVEVDGEKIYEGSLKEEILVRVGWEPVKNGEFTYQKHI